MCIGLASQNQHDVQAAKIADVWPVENLWGYSAVLKMCESETKEQLQRYNEEECRRIDERQGYVQEVKSIPKRLQVNVSIMSFTSPVIGQLLCSST